MITGLEKQLFTVQEYNKMIELGNFLSDERIELIKGEIIKMSPLGRRQAACINRLIQLFGMRLFPDVIIGAQNPLQLAENSQPQPDILLLKKQADFYESGHPQSPDFLLLVEVADTTIKVARDIKMPLYAENGIIEAWLVDLNGQYVEVYRQPTDQGYKQIQQYYRDDFLTILSLPNTNFSVNQILGE